MATKIIEPTDAIEVKCVPLLIYGPPGIGKTSLAQTAPSPLTLDFDKGIHRTPYRKRAAQFDSWADMVKSFNAGEFKKAETLVIDTVGRALDTLIPAIMAENSKNTYNGGLTIAGYGVLGNRFATWMRQVLGTGQNVVVIAHEEEARDGDRSRYYPDMPGKMALKEIHKGFDMIGRVRWEGRSRVLDFNPSDSQLGKNAAGLGLTEIGNPKDHPELLTQVLQDAREALALTAAISAEVAKATEEWTIRLEHVEDLDVFNTVAPEVGKLTGPAKTQVWNLVQQHAANHKWAFDGKSKKFLPAA